MCRCYGTSSAPVRLRGVHAAAPPGPERGWWCSDARDDPLGLHEHYTRGAIVVIQGGTPRHCTTRTTERRVRLLRVRKAGAATSRVRGSGAGYCARRRRAGRGNRARGWAEAARIWTSREGV